MGKRKRSEILKLKKCSKSETNISSLPDNVFFQIFEFLTHNELLNCRAVSKSWKEKSDYTLRVTNKELVIVNENTQHDIGIIIDTENCVAQFNTIFHLFPNITNIAIYSTSFPVAVLFYAFRNKFQYVTTIEIDSDDFDFKIGGIIAECFPNIKSLSLSNVEIADNEVITLLRKLQLEELRLVLADTTGSFIPAIPNTLKLLHVSYCAITWSQQLLIGPKLCLEKLEVEEGTIGKDFFEFLDNVFPEITSLNISCSVLEDLHCFVHNKILDFELLAGEIRSQYFFKPLCSVKSFDVDIHRLSENDLAFLLQMFPNIESLIFVGSSKYFTFTPRLINSFKSLKFLKKWSISDTRMYTEKYIIYNFGSENILIPAMLAMTQ
ncbi:hypothetical protein B4U80_13320, partial [Leptotrombidium deliense]